MSSGKKATRKFITFQQERIISKYSGTSLQRPPWRQKKVAIVERFKQESMYGLSAKTNDCCTEEAIVERWPLVEVRLYF